MSTEAGPFDMWSGEDTVMMLFLAVALVALFMCWVLIGSNVALRRECWQHRKDNEKLGNRLRNTQAVNRRLRWEMAQLRGTALTAEQHLGLPAAVVDERPEYGPGNVGPDWCYTPLAGAERNPFTPAVLTDNTATSEMAVVRELTEVGA